MTSVLAQGTVTRCLTDRLAFHMGLWHVLCVLCWGSEWGYVLPTVVGWLVCVRVRMPSGSAECVGTHANMRGTHTPHTWLRSRWARVPRCVRLRGARVALVRSKKNCFLKLLNRFPPGRQGRGRVAAPCRCVRDRVSQPNQLYLICVPGLTSVLVEGHSRLPVGAAGGGGLQRGGRLLRYLIG